MTKVQLNQKEQHYAGTREQAEEIILVAKENESLQMHKISEKYNKYGQYFLIDLTFAYQTPKEVMESRPVNTAPDGQLSIDEHEGIEVKAYSDGTVEVAEGQIGMGEIEVEEVKVEKDDLPFEVKVEELDNEDDLPL